MVVAVVHNKDAGVLMDKLVANRFSVTKVNTSGGFLRESNATLLIGVEDNKVEEVLDIIRSICRTRIGFMEKPVLNISGSTMTSVFSEIALIFSSNKERLASISSQTRSVCMSVKVRDILLS